MSIPALTSVGGLYRLHWAEEQVVIHLDRLYEDSHYQCSAEIQINTTAAGGPNHLHGGSRLNLTSAEARRRLAKYLNEDVWPNNWTTILEQTAVMVLAQWRKGPPLITLASHKPAERLRMRVEPILQEQQATVFYGEGDSLKSFLGLFIGVLVNCGKPKARLTPEKGRVLYLDYETDADTTYDRMNMIAVGMALETPEGLKYRQMVQPLAADIQQINRIVLDQEINLVIIDSAAPAVLEPESASMTTEYFRALRSLNATSLTIAHVAKNSKADSPYGSAFWRNLPRATFHVIADRESQHTKVTLLHTKSNNGRRLPPLGFQFLFDNLANRVEIETCDPRKIASITAQLSNRDRIAFALSEAPSTKLSLDDLSEELNMRKPAISTCLSQNPQQFVQVERGVWGLKVRTEDE